MTGVLAAAGDMSTGEAVLFWILAPVVLGGAFGMVLAKNAVHSALFLVASMFGLGVFYFVQQGPFLGAVQIIVYTGAIMILFLFVLMLVGRDASDSVVETLRGQRTAALVLGIGFAALVGGAIYRATEDVDVRGIADVNASVANIAARLFADYVFAFELTSALLITAAVGAMVLAHVERPPGTRRTQKQLSQERFRRPHPQPKPGPGVFATSNSIATPALLPDGSIAEQSMSRLVEPNLTGVVAHAPAIPPAVPPGGEPKGVSSTDTQSSGSEQ